MVALSDLTPEQHRLLSEQTVELASWAFGNAGTRFKVFSTPGTPRDPFEKVADAAQVHRFTGITPRVSLHIPWDETEDYAKLRAYAKDQGITLGNINSNVFQDDDYKFGSLTNSDPKLRRKAIDAHKHCIDIMGLTGSDTLKIWLGDGTNYPGQDSIDARQDRLADSLQQIYGYLSEDQKLLLEYKFFEPAFYATDVPDWGTALLHVLALGERAVVCLDTGHHAPGTNVEFIVNQLLRAGRLGAFDFNSRFYADDDLMVGAADPFQLFRIMNEIVSYGALDKDSGVNFMLDQCHQLEEKIPGEIRSAMNVQEATAKALLVDREALSAAQEAHDVLGANGVLMDAFYTDVRPLLAELREEQGLDPDPYGAFLRSGYLEKVREERVGGTQASWGA
ncbi:MAG: L-rhamnose isomerase [Actinomyces sp.]|jgi:L-rhamnose isomerase/sugar isomerase|nr:L-rhamnose isomerase [Actinomyces sp.]MCI1642559.1 L-rhamnose isomerase [Actinomyces sp.]MCI1662484.1 L-rhamnose isomerase [Actinomyces sp.]MCI1691739.1 L-rhamnose isomerase [Actinomyces sp.]